MKLYRLERREHDGLATRGELLAPEGRRLAYTIEDRYRPVKVAGTTRIPAGRYELELKPIGTSRFDRSAAKILAAKGLAYRGMIRLKAVPGFSEILIHWGNFHTDTEGCLCVGLTRTRGPDGALAVGASRDAFALVYPPVAAAIAAGPAFIDIVNLDGTPEGK